MTEDNIEGSIEDGIENKKYPKGTYVWLIEKAKEYGCPHTNVEQVTKWLWENGITKGWNIHQDAIEKRLKNAGCKTIYKYNNKCARKLGYRDNSEQVMQRLYDKGTCEPMSINEDCASNFGIYKGEEILKMFLEAIFENAKYMRYGNKGFEFICKNPKQDFIKKYPHLMLAKEKEYKIDVKARCLRDNKKGWTGFGYLIDYNKVADYFILTAWDSRDYLNIFHVWMFHKDNIVRGERFWKRTAFSITNKSKYMVDLRKYELIDELEILKEAAKKYKDKFI
jgi:hypothetical protein